VAETRWGQKPKPAAPAPPAEPPERRELPSEREGRRGRSLRRALLFSLLVHGLLLVAAFLLARRIPLPPILQPQPAERVAPIIVRLTDQRALIKAEKPPETSVIGIDDANASSPGEGPPKPHGESSEPNPGRRGRPQPAQQPEPPRPEQPEPNREPDVTREPRSPTSLSLEDKRRRIADTLGRIGSFGEMGEGGTGQEGLPSSGLYFESGGDSSMQIESRSDVDWGPWAERVTRKVKDNWMTVMPVAARVGMKGLVTVRFVVHRDGTITDYEVLETSGIPPLDKAVDDALIGLSNPLPPLPLPPDSDEEHIRVTYQFSYSLEDDRERRAWRRANWQRLKAEKDARGG
jgi:protein TonB